MKRQNIEGGSWFDVDAAELFSEGTRWDGHNHISLATGSQWEHERLYRTRNGRWVLNAWDDWQGGYNTWRLIDADDAAAWLATHNHEAALRFFPDAFSKLEV